MWSLSPLLPSPVCPVPPCCTATYFTAPLLYCLQVANDSRLLYCHLLANWHLSTRLGRPAEAFAHGLAQMIPLTALR